MDRNFDIDIIRYQYRFLYYSTSISISILFDLYRFRHSRFGPHSTRRIIELSSPRHRSSSNRRRPSSPASSWRKAVTASTLRPARRSSLCHRPPTPVRQPQRPHPPPTRTRTTRPLRCRSLPPRRRRSPIRRTASITSSISTRPAIAVRRRLAAVRLPDNFTSTVRWPRMRRRWRPAGAPSPPIWRPPWIST